MAAFRFASLGAQVVVAAFLFVSPAFAGATTVYGPPPIPQPDVDEQPETGPADEGNPLYFKTSQGDFDLDPEIQTAIDGVTQTSDTLDAFVNEDLNNDDIPDHDGITTAQGANNDQKKHDYRGDAPDQDDDPDGYAAWVQKGIDYDHYVDLQGDVDEASKTLNKAYRDNPPNANALAAGANCAEQLDPLAFGLGVAGYGTDLAGAIAESITSPGSIVGAEIAANVAQAVGLGLGLASTVVEGVQMNLPNCDGEFTGTVQTHANFVAHMGLSTFDGAIDIGYTNSLLNSQTFYDGITLGGGALAGAGKGGEAAETFKASDIAIGNGSKAGSATDPVGKNTAFGDDAEATGGNSTAIGAGSRALGLNSVAVGQSTAGGTNGIAIGYMNNSGTGENNTAIGSNISISNGDNNTVLGVGHQVVGSENFVGGDPNFVTGTGNAVIGNQNYLVGDYNQIYGSYNGTAVANLYGHGNSVLGSGNTFGTSPVAQAYNNKIVGDDNSIAGTGNFNNILGSGNTVYNSGTHNFIGGNGADVTGDFGIAIGEETTVTGNSATAIGRGAQALEDGAIALGRDSSVADGSTNGVAIGRNAVVDGIRSIALGNGATADGDHASALGPDSYAGGLDSSAVGNFAQATQQGATALGGGGGAAAAANASGEFAVAIGGGATDGASATANDAVAIGQASLASQNANVAIGKGATADDTNNVAIGDGAQATDNDATAVGDTAVASGDNSTAIGQDSTASDTNTTALGERAEASGGDATALGENSLANSDDSTALGQHAVAIDENATAVGNDAAAWGRSSTAVGENSFAFADHSTALGQGTFALATNAVAVGEDAFASGISSTATGQSAYAGAFHSSAYGQDSSASGVASTAIGAHTSTNGYYNSAAFGYEASVDRNNQQKFGTQSNTYTMPGITTYASTSFQQGPLSLVTTDAYGNLAADQNLYEQIGQNRQGVAMAMAMSNFWVPYNKTFTAGLNVATWDGTWAIAGNMGGELMDGVHITGGMSISETGMVGARAGGQISW